MKRRHFYVVSFLILQIVLAGCGFTMPNAELTVYVTDTAGNPISGAEVGAFFPHIYGAGSSVKGKSIKVKTNTHGIAVLKGEIAGSVGGGVEFPGYYRTQFPEIDFLSMHHNREVLKAERYVILKEVRNPTPLYARLFRNITIPNLNASFGFDFEIGDWVTPFGKGKNTDIIFQIKGCYNSYRDHDLTLEITFPNKGDGLIEFEGMRNVGSQLRSAYLAPEEGCQPTLKLRKKALYEQSSSQWLNESKAGRNYYLRVRTTIDENGKVVCANYGKIYGNFEFLDYIQAEAYYFNPVPNNKNIEFDVRQNFAKSQTGRSQVRMP